ncbi:MAG: TIGR02646 family protein [Verrucomicrobiaceae bacterium]|nr:MAG: TIGR02646 family protein [Verrucomicrobiaceae bacterium]
MRPIRKGAGPDSLTRHRARPHSDYANYAEKDDLRESLVAEQGAICCYCMQRIHADGALMKIEHWACQEDHADQDLDYGNLLGACPGGEGRPGRLQHCDTSKGKRSLCRHPAVNPPRVDRDIHYLADGTVTSDDASFDGELNHVLHLNLERLKNNRKAVLDALKDWAETFPRLRRTDVKAELREWIGMEDGCLREYAQVAVYWLTKRLSKF